MMDASGTWITLFCDPQEDAPICSDWLEFTKRAADSAIEQSPCHIWELPGCYPVFTVVMVIYQYVDRILIILGTPIFCITYTIMYDYYAGEPVNIHIQSLINITLENNMVITTKKR